MDSILSQIKSGHLPASAKEAVVQGFMPLEANELLTALAFLVGEDDGLLTDAQATFDQMPESSRLHFFKDPEAEAAVLETYLLKFSIPESVLSEALINPSLPASVIKTLAPTLPENILDLAVNNQVKILEEPDIVNALKQNPHLSITQKQKLGDYERLLFKDLVSTEEELKDRSIEQIEQEAIADATEYVQVFGKESVTTRDMSVETDTKDSALKRLARMSVPQKVQAAIKGNREVRGILVREANKLVCTAVMKSPRITEAEVEFISNMRNVQTDVLRLIAMNREWLRNYKILHNLVRNPRTPLAFTMKLLPRIKPKDLRMLELDRGVPDALRKTAKRMVRASRK